MEESINELKNKNVDPFNGIYINYLRNLTFANKKSEKWLKTTF